MSINIIRCIQVALLTDTNTGFFTDGYQNIGNALSVLIVSITAIAAIFGLFVSTERINPQPDSSYVFGGAALLAGLSQLVEVFSLSISLEGVPTVISGARTAFMLGSGIVFCYIGIMHILGNNPHYGFMFVPVISWIFRLVYTFIGFTGMSNISDNLYDVLMLVSTTVFLLFHGKMLYGIKTKTGINSMFISGIIAILFSSVAIIPRWIVAVLGLKEFSHIQIDNPLSGFFMSVYITVYLILLCKKQKNNTSV